MPSGEGYLTKQGHLSVGSRCHGLFETCDREMSISLDRSRREPQTVLGAAKLFDRPTNLWQPSWNLSTTATLLKPNLTAHFSRKVLELNYSWRMQHLERWQYTKCFQFHLLRMKADKMLEIRPGPAIMQINTPSIHSAQMNLTSKAGQLTSVALLKS